ncbi:hypothetical protein SM033_00197 [Vibrio phage vB_VpaM_sm033]|nr:hypothetical protein SM033_00197 [Vibrio phage vB_VpaM_sm033]
MNEYVLPLGQGFHEDFVDALRDFDTEIPTSEAIKAFFKEVFIQNSHLLTVVVEVDSSIDYKVLHSVLYESLDVYVGELLAMVNDIEDDVTYTLDLLDYETIIIREM